MSKEITEINNEILRVTQSVVVKVPHYSKFGGYEGEHDIYTADIANALYRAGYREQSDTARKIIDEFIDALQGEIDQEETLYNNAFEACDVEGVNIHRYAEDKLETIKLALELYKTKYTK